ncbi:hypothetical protein [Thioalkalivibrio sp. ALMg11]|uniref:hypothetical protein n=1 Tax=Thioalkalivibrio sp. ALMg11 TaxID=1158165 RepID=UPI0012DBCFA7|nr:hypothetical protein [Thioalkalivibrio sp. ALMg11]
MLPNYSEIIELLKKGATIEAQEKVMALREGALELQEQNISLRERIRDLEARLSAVEDWAEQRKRYVLASPWRGPAQVYALKKTEAQDEPPHLLCANCFHNSKRVVLNPTRKTGWVNLVCPDCKAVVETGYRGIGEAQYAEDYEKDDN